MAGLFEDTIIDDSRIDDVLSTIVLAQADENPLVAMIGTPSEAVQKEFRWPALDEKNKPPKAYPDGHRHETFDSEQPIFLRGMCQEFREDWGVGWQAEGAATYTKHNKPAWQKGQALKRLNRQREIVYSSAQEQRDQIVLSAAGGRENADAGSKTRGIITALTPKLVSNDPQVLFPFEDEVRVRSGAFFDGGLSELTPEAFEELLSAIAIFRKKSVNLMGLMGLRLKRHLSSWIQRDEKADGWYNVSTRRYGEQFDVNMIVDTFRFDAGVVRTAVSYNLNYDLSTGLATAATPFTGLLIEPDLFKLRRFKPLEHKEPGDDGQGKTGFYRIMEGLQSTLPGANGLIIATDDSDGDVEVTPSAPTVLANVVTIPTKEGVEYQDADGDAPLTGTVTLNGDDLQTITINAVAKAGYKLKSGATASWTFDYDDGLTEVTPTAPTVDNNIVTIPAKTGVIYKDDSDGSVLSAPVTLNDSSRTFLVVKAEADDGYKFPAGAEKLWAFYYNAG